MMDDDLVPPWAEPTSWGDMVADLMRAYYDRNREGWWAWKTRREDIADNLMLGLLIIAERNVRARIEWEQGHAGSQARGPGQGDAA